MSYDNRDDPDRGRLLIDSDHDNAAAHPPSAHDKGREGRPEVNGKKIHADYVIHVMKHSLLETRYIVQKCVDTRTHSVTVGSKLSRHNVQQQSIQILKRITSACDISLLIHNVVRLSWMYVRSLLDFIYIVKKINFNNKCMIVRGKCFWPVICLIYGSLIFIVLFLDVLNYS